MSDILRLVLQEAATTPPRFAGVNNEVFGGFLPTAKGRFDLIRAMASLWEHSQIFVSMAATSQHGNATAWRARSTPPVFAGVPESIFHSGFSD